MDHHKLNKAAKRHGIATKSLKETETALAASIAECARLTKAVELKKADVESTLGALGTVAIGVGLEEAKKQSGLK